MNACVCLNYSVIFWHHIKSFASTACLLFLLLRLDHKERKLSHFRTLFRKYVPTYIVSTKKEFLSIIQLFLEIQQTMHV